MDSNWRKQFAASASKAGTHDPKQGMLERELAMHATSSQSCRVLTWMRWSASIKTHHGAESLCELIWLPLYRELTGKHSARIRVVVVLGTVVWPNPMTCISLLGFFWHWWFRERWHTIVTSMSANWKNLPELWKQNANIRVGTLDWSHAFSSMIHVRMNAGQVVPRNQNTSKSDSMDLVQGVHFKLMCVHLIFLLVISLISGLFSCEISTLTCSSMLLGHESLCIQSDDVFLVLVSCCFLLLFMGHRLGYPAALCPKGRRGLSGRSSLRQIFQMAPRVVPWWTQRNCICKGILSEIALKPIQAWNKLLEEGYIHWFNKPTSGSTNKWYHDLKWLTTASHNNYLLLRENICAQMSTWHVNRSSMKKARTWTILEGHAYHCRRNYTKRKTFPHLLCSELWKRITKVNFGVN